MSAKKTPEQLCHVIRHPLLSHKLALLRRKQTQPNEFRKLLKEISCLMSYEITRDLQVKDVDIETPLQSTRGPMVSEPVVLVAIQRAGNGMLDGMLEMLQFARVGHIGIYRDKFIKNTVEYYLRLPNNSEGQCVLLMDPCWLLEIPQ
jgi:uracil phosphoribosyltransferase (EC 2.4.2.9)